MKKLYKFYLDCGRMGHLEGVFVAECCEVRDAIGKRYNFGEALGKHSQIDGTLEEKDITVVTDDKTVINVITEHLDGSVGRNPLNYLLCEHGCMDDDCYECPEQDDAKHDEQP